MIGLQTGWSWWCDWLHPNLEVRVLIQYSSIMYTHVILYLQLMPWNHVAAIWNPATPNKTHLPAEKKNKNMAHTHVCVHVPWMYSLKIYPIHRHTLCIYTLSDYSKRSDSKSGGSVVLITTNSTWFTFWAPKLLAYLPPVISQQHRYWSKTTVLFFT